MATCLASRLSRPIVRNIRHHSELKLLLLPRNLQTSSRMSTAYTATVAKASTGAVPEDAAAKSHHVMDKRGNRIKFRNPHPSAGEEHSVVDVFRRMGKARRNGEMEIPSTANHKIRVIEPTFLPSRTASDRLRATWLGHACYYMEYPSGIRVLFDPVFETHCSPLPEFLSSAYRRFTPAPCQVAEIPIIDAVVISHSHYDHLSHPTVKQIAARHPQAHFFVGLGLARWFRSSGIANVTELDWWEDAELRLKAADGSPDATATISCLPSQHASGRGPLDKDTTLWASWAVSSGGRSVWFAGDTGYRKVPELPAGEDDYGPQHASLPRNPDFAKIGALRGPFDLGLIPVGAYKPRWLWSQVHADPFDAVEIFKDARCTRALGKHWGTWHLTSEDVDEPPKLLREALKRSGIAEEGVFDVCSIGESREF
ncbi:hypothetical protein MCOR07_004243 [Pyricularia oryzae]|uniref:Metallo-beta-lactamase domain-containing protein n=2 Tax=Pyricularia TaxID=48558 RepID=A0ABQ8NN75_PYRGI|nr:hypothetical protein MCOR33_004401 [Pyricularia grisea]KAI6464075.1 hypothetical protein MCOR17_005447 [Pyricularia oryzae]KAI6484465.1 hypothetical protein MCOR11_010079 [Pyricularia oryzae]KAI6622753.1 hypothetical protein MCOR07_004243 [Pyricularia oryzae]QBZ58629.1 hypothetical protein PoMZ_03585 [Pyricularia oryzae]